MHDRQAAARGRDARRTTGIALAVGLTALVAVVVHAGAGAVGRAVESLRLRGLLLLVLLHLPIVALMGVAWWLASGADPPAARSRYLWARFVRNAGAEALPFLQFGGVVLGLRALGRGRAIAVRGAVAASIDGVIELTAQLPYVLAALLTVLVLAPHSRLARPLFLWWCAAAAFVAILLCARRSLSAWLEWATRAVTRRLPAILSLHGADIDGEVQGSFDRIVRERRRLWSAFALHLCCWYLGAAEAWVGFRLVGIDLTLLQALAIDGAVAALRTFGFMVPAALGIQETSYLVAAAAFGIPPAGAVAASLARRARDLTLGVGTLVIALIGDANFGVWRSWLPKGMLGATRTDTESSTSEPAGTGSA